MGRHIIEIVPASGLEQKLSPQRLPAGKSAKAINLVAAKAGQLDKRLGYFPLSKVDPFGSGYALSAGVALAKWNPGEGQDNLVVVGRGQRASSGGALATSLQTYSDDLGGPVLRGPAPDVSIVGDEVSSGSSGTAFSVCSAVSGDFLVTVWIDPATDFALAAGSRPQPQPPIGQCGVLTWSAKSLSTGQTVVGPATVDAAGGQFAQYVRLAVVGTTFVVCYSAAKSNGYIYARALTLLALTTGGGWSATQTITAANGAAPNPYAQTLPPKVLFPPSTNAEPGGQFDMRAVIGDATSFVVAYETGTWVADPPHWTGTSIVVDRWAVANVSAGTGARTSQWVVAAAPPGVSVAGGFGVRADSGLGFVVVAWAQAQLNNPYLIWGAAGQYPAMTGWSNPTFIGSGGVDATQTAPSWLDVSYANPGFGTVGFAPPIPVGQFVVSHSPMGACWNAAFTTSQAIKSQGVGASAHAVMTGTLREIRFAGQTGYTGWTTAPTVSISGGGGSGATGAINIAGGLLTSVNVTAAGNGFTSVPAILAQGGAGPAGFLVDPLLAGVVLYSLSSFVVDAAGQNYTAAPTVLIGSGGNGSGAVITFTNTAGVLSAPVISNPGSGYTSVPDCTIVDSAGNGIGAILQLTVDLNASSATYGQITGAAFVASLLGPAFIGGTFYTAGSTTAVISGGASATATVDANGHVTGVSVTTAGSNFAAPPSVTLLAPQSSIGLQQQQPVRLGMSSVGSGNAKFPGYTQLWFPQNNARIVQTQFSISTSSGANLTVSATTGGANYCITPGVTLASCGLEANGIVYFLGWIPSATQGGFVILAFDLGCNPTNTLPGAQWPMRPVGSLQTRTALGDPGYGFQPVPQGPLGPDFEVTFPAAWQFQSTASPNAWTGGSAWALSTDSYGTAYVSYVSSAVGGRLSPAVGTVQTQPRQGYPSAPWGNSTAIGGALPSIFDGQNLFEQGFLYAPESILVSPIDPNLSHPMTGGLTWNSATDAYKWIFTWEHFDAQGNFHTSARAPVTVTGQDILDVMGPGTVGPLSSYAGYNTMGPKFPISASLIFTLPSLGITNRQWPNHGGAVLGNDLRALSAAPSDNIVIGVYRTAINGTVFSRIGDRFFNGDDLGDTSFSLAPPVSNPSDGRTSFNIIDGLSDEVLFGTSTANPFPLLYGDGTNGVPGSLDQLCPPASNLLASDASRLYVARDNRLLWTKARSGELGSNTPGYYEAVNSMVVGDGDPIVGLAVTDSKIVVLKGGGNWYLAGSGPADDGSGGAFQGPEFIPTDAGCVSARSVISTPEGIYYQSNAGLRLIDRGNVVRYVGGPVEDELARATGYNTVLGAVLYPQANRLVLLASIGDAPAAAGPNAGQVVGELLVRDYFLDTWTTAIVMNAAAQTGFVSAAVAFGRGAGTGSPLFLQTPSIPRLHLLGADGQVWREHDPLDGSAFFDNGTYVSWTWLSPPILCPADGDQEQTLQGRYRMRDINALLKSHDPHGMVVSVAIDYGPLGLNRTWAWNTSGQPSIAPGGVNPTNLTELRTYDGRLGGMFQVQLQDVSDPSSATGQGSTLIGLSCLAESVRGLYRLPASRTQ